MPDDPQAAQATQEPQAEPAPELPDLTPQQVAALLDRYHDDPDKRGEALSVLRAHPFVANIAGDLAERQRQQRDQEAARKAVEEEQARLRKLADEDPDAFASELKVRWDKEAADKRFAEVRATTRQEYIQRIGTALRDIPEVRNLTAEEHAAYVRAVAGASEDDLLPITQRFFTDLIASKRAKGQAEKDLADRLKAERKVWEKEQADKRLKTRAAPSVVAPTNGNAQDTGEPKDYLSPEWNMWYERQRKAGALTGQRR